MNREIGRVLGTADAQPLDFWVAVPAQEILQLDDVVLVNRELSDGRTVSLYGMVDMLVARHEGARLESDVFLGDEGVLPLQQVVKAHVTVTRVEPEIFVPPMPGILCSRRRARTAIRRYSSTPMKKRFPLGLARDGEPVHGNFEFLDGSRGAHVNISGISGVATKTTYATFLLYGIFNGGLLGGEVGNTHALIFNVKGEDLLFLDKPNTALQGDQAALYDRLGLKPGPFPDVAIYAPVKAGQDYMLPDTGKRSDVSVFAWTIAEFCKQRYLRYLFTEADDESNQISFVAERVEAMLAQYAPAVDTFEELVDHIIANPVQGYAAGTIAAFERRLRAAVPRVGRLIRGKVDDVEKNTINWQRAQVTVIDIHNLHDRAKRFVIGVVLRRMFEDKEKTGSRKPLAFVVLDELNECAHSARAAARSRK